MQRTINLSEIVLMDIEASGLGDDGYPIEVGFVCAANLTGWSTLITPVEEWLELGGWDYDAEATHGIGQAELNQNGRDVLDVARLLNAQLAGKAVFCDGLEFDRHWLEMLFEAAFEQPCFQLYRFQDLLAGRAGMVVADILMTQPKSPLPMIKRHRAYGDALALAVIRRGITTP